MKIINVNNKENNDSIILKEKDNWQNGNNKNEKDIEKDKKLHSNNNKSTENNDISIQGNIINFSDINFYERNIATATSNESTSSMEALSLHANTVSNNIVTNEFYNDGITSISENQNKIKYKLLDEGIINEGFSLDFNETIENIINNRIYIPSNIDIKDGDLYSVIHDKELRKKYFNPSEIKICPLLDDPIPEKYLPQTENYQTEIKILSEKINESKTTNYECYKYRAFLYLLIGDYKSAYRDFSDAIHYEKQNSDCYWYRHLLSLKFDKPSSAIKDLEYVTEYSDNNSLNFYVKSRLYEVLDNKKFAIYNYTCLIQIKPHMIDAYVHRGLLLEAQKQYSYALEDFKNVYQRDCNNIIAIRFLSIYYYKNNLYHDAIKAMSRWINIQPSNHKVYFLRGKAQTKLNMWTSAYEDFNNAIKLCPGNSKYYLYRGCIERNRNPTKAIEDFSISLLLDNSVKNLNAYFYRAFVYYTQNDNDYAFHDLNKIISLDNRNVIAYINLGIITLNRYNQLYEALDYFNHALECDPNNVQGYICRGNVYSRMYKQEINRKIASFNIYSIKFMQKKTTYLDRSIRDYSRAIHLNPSNFIYYLFRGRLLLQAMLTNEAKLDFCTAFELNASIAQTAIQKFLILSFQKKWEQIISEYKRTDIEIQNDSNIYIIISRAYKNINNLEKSLKVIEKGLIVDVSNENLYLEKGIILLAFNKFDEALNNLSKALSINPKLSSGYYYRSLCYFELGDIDASFEDISKAIKTDTFPFNAYLIRASIYNYKNLYSLGIEDCNEALKFESLSICGYLLRGSMRFKLKQYGLALNDFTMASFIDGKCYYAYFNRAITYQLIEEPENALKDFSSVLLLTDNPEAYKYRGLLYWQLGDFYNATVDLKKALETYKDDFELYCQYGLCLNDYKQYDKAIIAFNKAIELNRCNDSLFLNRGILYKKKKEFDKALKDFSKTLLLNPSNIDAYINIGYIYHKQKKYKKAMEMFSTAIIIKPENASALEGRAMLNYDLKNYFSALYDISHALELDFQNPQYHNNRGIIYKAMNDNMTALKCFKMAVYYDPNFYLAHYNIGNMYFIQKRYDKALISFNKVSIYLI
ncbi:TPR-like protein [Piromyces finnis]|uniref:TPR-like protein n=1 Tax=Piromyces finnis TaxID=1754191 RepID=A0A1Y1UXM2_9FUNG|nr:TPR-like protein [Piromyces finnis]|eukprot:ORX42469.1 TPR-like protein [Piromyces finnis]